MRLNVQASIKLLSQGRRKLELYGLVNNVFELEVPFPATQISGLYDRIGRFGRVGLRFSY